MATEVKPQAELLDYLGDSELNVATSARLTHSDKSPEEIKGDMSEETKERMAKYMIELGHDSTLENSFFYFKIRCSRVASHQLVRHRIGVSVAQRSQRYVEEDDFEFIVPPTIKGNKAEYEMFIDHMEYSRNLYQHYRSVGIPKEDARFILPQIATYLTVGFNARALRHFLKLRLDKTAQWEIRQLAEQILKQVKEVTPNLFHDLELQEENN